MAASAVVLLLALSSSSPSQTIADNHRESLVAPVQTASQVSTATAAPGQHALSPEEMGDLFMARKDYREAAQMYKRLSDENPTNAVYLNKLGIALHQQSALGLALKYYERAFKVDPQYADAENNVGTIWYQRKRFGRAIKAYQKAIQLRDDMPVLYSNLGYAYFGDKRYDDSIAAFRSALKIDPEFFERGGSRSGSVLQDRTVEERGRFYYLLAKSFMQSGDQERCLLYLRKAMEDGYAVLAEAKRDAVLVGILKDPMVVEELTPKVAEK
jgi:tetratricopeptide (TPR) repeat protein